MNSKQPHSDDLFFDPTNHPDDTLKAFTEFIQTFQLRYAAQFPDPPKVSLDAALQRWKIANVSEAEPDPKPNLAQYDQVVADWQAKDKVAKFLGMFTSKRFYNDWLAAQPDETLRNNAGWTEMVRYITDYYKPTENLTLKNYHFRTLTQGSDQTFAAFCNHVEKEAKHCSFKCHHADCTASSTAVRDQVLFGTTNNKIREEAFNKSWDLPTLRKEGMRMESASKSAAELSGEAVNRMGSYSYKNIRTKPPQQHNQPPKTFKPITCFNCGSTVTTSIRNHVRRECPAIGKKCAKCDNIGHFTQCCKKFPMVNQVHQEVPMQHPQAAPLQPDEEETYNINIFHVDAFQENTDSKPLLYKPSCSIIDIPDNHKQSENIMDTTGSTDPHLPDSVVDDTEISQHEELPDDTYNMNIFLVKSSTNRVLPKLKSNLSSDFRAPVVINNCYDKPLSDTGAKVSVCGTVQARKWNILNRMVPSNAKLKPYNSSPIPVLGIARCAVTFGSTSIPVEWHIISGTC